MTYRRCNRNIGFRVTEEEWNTFNNQMQKWGIPKSIYLRCLINGIVITGGMTEEAEKVIQELQQIDKSINRLIKATNYSDEAKFYLFHHYFQEIQNCILKVIRSTQKNVTFNGEQLVDLMKKEDHNALAVLNKN